MIVSIAESFSPYSKVGVYVLATENNTEYTSITITAGGRYNVLYKHIDSY